MAMDGAQTFKHYRELRERSLEDVALAIGVSEGAVWQWENGRTTPRRNNAIKIDRYLDADEAVLAAFGYAPVSPPSDGEWVPLERFLELARRVDELTEQVQVMGAEVARLSRARRRGAN